MREQLKMCRPSRASGEWPVAQHFSLEDLGNVFRYLGIVRPSGPL